MTDSTLGLMRLLVLNVATTFKAGWMYDMLDGSGRVMFWVDVTILRLELALYKSNPVNWGSSRVGAMAGFLVGVAVGCLVGALVGAFVGTFVGAFVVAFVGALLGRLVGASEEHASTLDFPCKPYS